MTPALAEDVAYLDYRLRWRAEDSRPGKHPARQSGIGGDFQAIRPFWQLPDAQRIDIRRSIVDPFGEVMVRQTEQRSAITVVLAADLSASMQPDPARSNLPAIATIAAAAARSALRAGDSFGFFGFDGGLRRDATLAPTRTRAAVGMVATMLGAVTPTGRSAAGVSALAAELGRRCLLLLASDFLMPLPLIETALISLARHDIAPIVLTQDEAPRLPRRGLVRLRDVETGRSRLLLLRPALHRRWREDAARRREALDLLFRRHGRSGYFAGSRIDIAALSEHLLEG